MFDQINAQEITISTFHEPNLLHLKIDRRYST